MFEFKANKSAEHILARKSDMADINVGSDSAHSEFEEVGTSAIEGSNYSDGEIIDNDWHYELETMLNEPFVDQGMIKNVCKSRNVPDKFR